MFFVLLTCEIFANAVASSVIHPKVSVETHSASALTFRRHAEVLAALQPFSHWMSQLYSEIQQAGHSQAQLSHLLNGYVDVITPVLTKQVRHDPMMCGLD